MFFPSKYPLLQFLHSVAAHIIHLFLYPVFFSSAIFCPKGFQYPEEIKNFCISLRPLAGGSSEFDFIVF